MTYHFSSVQSLSHVRLFATPWTEACQASLSITNSWSSPKPMSIKSLMPSSHLILCHPLLPLPLIFTSIRVFSNELTLCMLCPNIGASASASVPSMNSQDWLLKGYVNILFGEMTAQGHLSFFKFDLYFFYYLWNNPTYSAIRLSMIKYANNRFNYLPCTSHVNRSY